MWSGLASAVPELGLPRRLEPSAASADGEPHKRAPRIVAVSDARDVQLWSEAIRTSWSSGYGYLVEMSHRDGTSTRYAHNSRLLVKKGQFVPQSSRISLMGSTGRSTGPHLHFEIRRPGGAAMDPMAMLPPR